MIAALLLVVQPVPANCADEHVAIAEIADAIDQKYVLVDAAKRSAAAVRSKLEQGAFYQDCDDSEAFAKHMTKQLRAILSDGHVFVEYAPNSSQAGEGDWLEEWRNGAPARGFGVRQVERIKSNISYLHLTDFFEFSAAEKALTAAFELVSRSDGLILDLRKNPGGSPETEWPVQWTFMAPGSQIPLHRETRLGKKPDLEEPTLSWPRYGAERPLAIIVDKTTFSAPEAVAYSLQAQGRAVIFGSPSGGGAHMLGDAVPLTGGWHIVIPETRPYSPHTGGNWEGTGVIPDIETSNEGAVETAQKWIAGELESKRAASKPETAP
ncbi:S41 family peptidase [Parasphingorhabdus cellanae]|uniref:S41 family peptidase n=1 Tax=Parasphingorhabdus cellanae TaxID=2806553 RepID=A0ABX7T0A6_9SPHN|nr:S41 family peptidase [Parasphingorhabdus cellanae]QTD54976.1 S41 family peptidase [Parasphingorhabdus cellanae]